VLLAVSDCRPNVLIRGTGWFYSGPSRHAPARWQNPLGTSSRPLYPRAISVFVGPSFIHPQCQWDFNHPVSLAGTLALGLNEALHGRRSFAAGDHSPSRRGKRGRSKALGMTRFQTHEGKPFVLPQAD